MAEQDHQRDLIIRYLLGVASKSERSSVEDQCFADAAGVALLLSVEDELIDDYVRGVLGVSDRLLFERFFLCTTRRIERLEMVQSLVEVLTEEKAAAETISPKRDSSLKFEFQVESYKNLALQKSLAVESQRFEALLNWLDSDREKAGEKYENIRLRLIELFALRGFADAEQLADETFRRVSLKITQTIESYVGDPVAYFYGVARNLMYAKAKNEPVIATPPEVAERDPEKQQRCMEKCLDTLSEPDRDLIRRYYFLEGQKRLLSRTELALSLGVSLNALRLRVHRLRKTLQACVKTCLEDKGEKMKVK